MTDFQTLCICCTFIIVASLWYRGYTESFQNEEPKKPELIDRLIDRLVLNPVYTFDKEEMTLHSLLLHIHRMVGHLNGYTTDDLFAIVLLKENEVLQYWGYEIKRIA